MDWTEGRFRLISLIDTSASMTGTLRVEAIQESVDKLANDFDR